MQKTKRNILDHDVFPNFDRIFRCLLKKVKASGRGNTEHYEEVSNEDLLKITNTLNPEVSQQLQYFVFLIIGIFFARRGRENIHVMKKSNILIKTDSRGKRFIQLQDELTKNHQSNDTERASGGCIF